MLTALLPVLLKIEANQLYPNSPIEVRAERDKFAIYCEDAWYTDCVSIEDARWQIGHLVYMYASDWLSLVCRINPDWVGWPKVSKYSLVILSEEYIVDGKEA